MNAFTQDRIRDLGKENLPKLTINLQFNYWKKPYTFRNFLLNLRGIYWIYDESKYEFNFMFTLHRKVPFWLEFTFTIFFYCFELFLNLLYSDLRNFLHSIQISSNEAVSKYVQNVLAMASEVFCLVFLLVLLLQPSKVCFETKGNNVDLYLNSHACAISPV